MVMDLVPVLADVGESGRYLAYVLFITGIALMIVEMFLPGMVVGVTGFVCAVIGIIVGFHTGGMVIGITLTVVGVVSLPVFLIVWLKVVAPAMALKAEVGDDEERLESQRSLLGQEGVATSMLRPAGVAQFGDRRVDVVTGGEIIDQDTRIEAVDVRGNQVVVRAVRL
jgi:membrane-bound serine protease (ClpP class)